jgi:hypothetical protein
MCLGVKHTFTNGGKCKRWSPMIPKCNSHTLGITLMQEYWMFRTLVAKQKKNQIGPPWYHYKSLEVYMPKVLSHCSFRLKMHELWSKEWLGIKLRIWLLTTNPFRARVKWALIKACSTPLEISFWRI